ncbi:hypothetical protein [Nonomuraea lactucae]|uniref:hypothetical protein n=1 Tax=Nonomuraea lactucae TaxID=2249762 RepID=UPI0013B37D26|nr:hypothetical protein [Nonomuraea lactucae]
MVVVLVGLGVVLVGLGDDVAVLVEVEVEVLVEVGVPVPTTRFIDGPPEAPGVQVYQVLPFTFSEKGPPLSTTVPVAVGRTTTAMVGIGIGEVGDTVVKGVEVAAAVTAVDASGLPLGDTVPSATTVLDGVIAESTGSGVAVVGCWMSQRTVTVALADGCTAGVFSSIRNGMLAVAPPWGAQP